MGAILALIVAALSCLIGFQLKHTPDIAFVAIAVENVWQIMAIVLTASTFGIWCGKRMPVEALMKMRLLICSIVVCFLFADNTSWETFLWLYILIIWIQLELVKTEI